MKGNNKFRHHAPGGAGGTPNLFGYTLDVTGNTFGGIFLNSTGALVRTLWINKKQAAGSYQVVWDGIDDGGNQLSSGTYNAVVSPYNPKPVWDGIIGNTSVSQSGPSVWRTRYPMCQQGALCFDGTTAYFACGFNEQQSPMKTFTAAAPNVPSDYFSGSDNAYLTVKYIATDGTNVYWANCGGGFGNAEKVFITAFKISDGSLVSFSSGVSANVHSTTFSAFDYSAGTASTISGLAVGGTYVAVAHSSANQVKLFNKTTGAAGSVISITAPTGVAFSSNGSLFVCNNGGIVTRIDNVGTTNNQFAYATALGSVSGAINIACHPSNADIVAVLDSATMQVKIFANDGSSVANIGTSGGYDTAGTTVSNSLFGWDGPQPPIAIDSNGGYWIGDGYTHRIVHYNSSRSYVDQVLWVPSCPVSCANETTPTQVFCGYNEYLIDYTQVIAGGDPGASGPWKFVKTHRTNLPTKLNQQLVDGQWTTDGIRWAGELGGRTFALAYDRVGILNCLCELTSTGLRDTGQNLNTDTESIYLDTATPEMRKYIDSGGVQTWYKSVFAGLDGSNNPTWGAYVEFAHYTIDRQGPAPLGGQWIGRAGIRVPKTTGNYYGVLNGSTPYNGSTDANTRGYHVGMFKASDTDFRAKACNSTSFSIPMDDKCGFPILSSAQPTYACDNMMAAGRMFIAGAHLETLGNLSQGNQFWMFGEGGETYTAFGTTGDIDSSATTINSIPGRTGNALNPWMVTSSDGRTWMYCSDEGEHGGLNRWNIVGAQALRRLSGTFAYNGTCTLSSSAAFVTDVTATGADTVVNLGWFGGSGTYTVKKATHSGGPYTTVASGISPRSYQVTGLTNGTPYFFVVQDSGSAIDSMEVSAVPRDLTVVTQLAGSAAYNHHNNSYYTVDTSLVYPVHMENFVSDLGTLRLRDVGKTKLAVFGYPTNGSTYTAGSGSVSITTDSNWTIDQVSLSLLSIWKINGVDGLRNCMIAGTGSPAGTSNVDATIDLNPGDTAWHYWTVWIPNNGGGTQSFTLVATPNGSGSPTATHTISGTTNHIVQYLLKGRCTLTIPAGATQGNIQAIACDPAEDI